ncbi:MAG TPA: IPT/TIG domain-containing protein [Haliangiales bacterium]|nr:IPT/TIG domain-containing protein [Haliangiales bacterium]
MRWMAFLWLVACAAEGPEPSVRALVPAQARPGEMVEIQGRGFAPLEDGFVAFGVEACGVVMWEDERIRVRVPTMHPGATTVVVTVDGRQSEPVRFEIE